MSATDLPLKLLVRQYIQDIASWLLGQEVLEAEELNVELTTEIPRVDLVFRLALAKGDFCLFHLEFQGRRSKPEMSRRQLNHLSRLALQGDWPLALESFVFYVEKYAGSQDSGQFQINRLDGSPSLSWHYTPIHLWQEPAEPLLTIGRRGIIPLMGLMKIQDPHKTLPEMVEQAQAEPDEERRQGLLGAMLALMSDQEHLTMLEKLVESDEFVLDTPFLRRYRRQIEESQAERAQEEVERARLVGQIEAHRDDILEVIAMRLNPPARIYREIERQIGHLNDLDRLRQLFNAALKVDDIEPFMTLLDLPVETLGL